MLLMITLSIDFIIKGEQLETIDKQRSRASESKELIEYFMAFNRGDISQLEYLRTQNGREGQFKVRFICEHICFNL